MFVTPAPSVTVGDHPTVVPSPQPPAEAFAISYAAVHFLGDIWSLV